MPRAAQIGAQVPDILADDELARLLQLDHGESLRALEAGLLPPSDRGRFWSRAAIAELAADPQALRARIPRPPLGARRCAVPCQVDVFRSKSVPGRTVVVDSPLLDICSLHM